MAVTNLVLDNPKSDTLPSTLSRADPAWELVPDIASSHWGTWLTVGVSVLGFPDPAFPPHNVRYETLYTPIQEDLEAAVETYLGGHESPIPTDDARDALRAQSYVLRTDPPTSSTVIYLFGVRVAVLPLYNGANITTGLVGEDFSLCEANVRGQGGYNETFSGTGNGPGGPLLTTTLNIPPVGPIWTKSRIWSSDDLWSDWSPISSSEWPP